MVAWIDLLQVLPKLLRQLHQLALVQKVKAVQVMAEKQLVQQAKLVVAIPDQQLQDFQPVH
jgi:hypothetical protein